MLNQQNLARREFLQFSRLQHLDTSNTGISNVGVETYSKHVQELHEDMKVQFQDVFQLEIPDWVIDRFINISEQGVLAKERITLQNDFKLKSKFSASYQSFWLRSGIKAKYPMCGIRYKCFSLHFPAHTQ